MSTLNSHLFFAWLLRRLVFFDLETLPWCLHSDRTREVSRSMWACLAGDRSLRPISSPIVFRVEIFFLAENLIQDNPFLKNYDTKLVTISVMSALTVYLVTYWRRWPDFYMLRSTSRSEVIPNAGVYIAVHNKIIGCPAFCHIYLNGRWTCRIQTLSRGRGCHYGQRAMCVPLAISTRIPTPHRYVSF